MLAVVPPVVGESPFVVLLSDEEERQAVESEQYIRSHLCG